MQTDTVKSEFAKIIFGNDYEKEVFQCRKLLRFVADKHENGSVLCAMRRLLGDAKEANKCTSEFSLILSVAALDLIDEKFSCQN